MIVPPKMCRQGHKHTHTQKGTEADGNRVLSISKNTLLEAKGSWFACLCPWWRNNGGTMWVNAYNLKGLHVPPLVGLCHHFQGLGRPSTLQAPCQALCKNVNASERWQYARTG